MQYVFLDRETPAAGICRIFNELLSHADELLSTDSSLDDASIHELRKTTKKLKAILALVSARLPRKRLRRASKALRHLSDQLGVARDSAVLLASLEHVREHFSTLLDDSATTPVRDVFEVQHQRLMQKQVENIDITGARCDLRTIRDALGKLDSKRITKGRLRKKIRKTFRHGRDALAELRAEPSTANSHHLRKEVKALWYQLRLFKKTGPTELVTLLSALDSLGEILGIDHDMAVLQDVIMNLPGIDSHQARKELLTSLIESRRIDLLGQAIRQAGQIYTAETKKLIGQLYLASGK